MEVSEGRKYFHEKKTKQELKRGENNKIKQTNEERQAQETKSMILVKIFMYQTQPIRNLHRNVFILHLP